VLPDLPVVTGVALPANGKVKDSDWARAVRWVRRLADPALALEGRVSEIDVSSAEMTRVVLAPKGARLLLPREAREADGLAALRVVLADLAARGVEAATIDCRARGLAVVEPVSGSSANQKDPESVGGTASVPRAKQDDHDASGPGPGRRRG
jgi:hypothetical protein